MVARLHLLEFLLLKIKQNSHVYIVHEGIQTKKRITLFIGITHLVWKNLNMIISEELEWNLMVWKPVQNYFEYKNILPIQSYFL